jgi:hypothetical protein
VLDKDTGARTKLLGEAGSSELEAAPIYARLAKGIFKSSFDEANGHVRILEGRADAEITILNMQVFASLLFQNTPTGRLMEEGIKDFEVLEDLPPPLEVTTLDAASANVVSDVYGKVYVRRRVLGKVPVMKDGSSKFKIPGGLPILFRLPETETSKARKLPRVQRESTMFAPGEYAHQAFRPQFFDGMCANCHGSISGRQVDIAVQPDMLSQASRVMARYTDGENLNRQPSERGPVESPTK